MAGTIETRLEQLGVTLPKAPAPAANYVPAVQSRGMLYVSGQLPVVDGAVTVKGRLGDGVELEEAQRAAKLCAINILAQARAALGDLDRIARIVRLTGYVAATPDFSDHPKVVNGASDFMAEVFGEKGRHARAAVGVASLPLGAAVEVDAVIEIV